MSNSSLYFPDNPLTLPPKESRKFVADEYDYGDYVLLEERREENLFPENDRFIKIDDKMPTWIPAIRCDFLP